MRSAILLVLASTTFALQWPFNLTWLLSLGRTQQLVLDAEPTAPRVPRIAIIGAGPGGSSAAYWLSLAKARGNLSFEVDLYERSAYIGGRSTVVHPYGNKDLPQIELGGSIFVKDNRNLMRATEVFGLERDDSDFSHSAELGIWDGKTFVFRSSPSAPGSWWSSFLAVLRYGIAAKRDLDLMINAMVEKFVTMYDSDFGVFDSISELISKVDAADAVAQSGTALLDAAGIKPIFSREIVEAATRVNYGTNLDDISAFGALVSMSARDAYTLRDGNYKIFESFVAKSDANVFLNTSVAKLAKVSSGWELTARKQTTLYDAIVLAAPLPFSNLKFEPALAAKVPDVEYVRLHVTLFTTTAKHASKEYFGVTPPPRILTTFNGARDGGPEPEFNSMNFIRPLSDSGDEWVVKIFSKKKISDEWLAKAFDGKIGWVHRKIWNAYPILKPSALDSLPPLILGDGLYYVNALEPFVSTMETETVASRNAVEILLRHHFRSSICPGHTKSTENQNATASSQPFVYGFDC